MRVLVNNREFILRACRDDDYWFVYRLVKRNMIGLFEKYWGGWKPDVFRKTFSKETITIVEYKTKRVAFCDLEIKDGFSFVKNVEISTLMRRKGLGSFLMTFMSKKTQEYGFSKIQLRVFKDNDALMFYSQMGYKEIEDEGLSIIIEKELSDVD